MPETIEANGIAINYEIEGPADAPVVTLSHSLNTNMAMWRPQLAALTGAYRVLRYDTRGHGGSDAPEGAYSLEMLAADVAGLLDGLSIERTCFVGLSMGGMIGQRLALDHPQRLTALVLCDTASGRGAQDESAWKQVWRQRIDGALAHGPEPGVEGVIDRWFSPAFVAANPAVVDEVRAMIRNTKVSGFVGCCHALSGLDLTARLPEIKLPTLIIVGEDDPGTPVAASRSMQEKIAGSQLTVLARARHLSNIEAADEFNQALTGFLAAHCAGRPRP